MGTPDGGIPVDHPRGFPAAAVLLWQRLWEDRDWDGVEYIEQLRAAFLPGESVMTLRTSALPIFTLMLNVVVQPASAEPPPGSRLVFRCVTARTDQLTPFETDACGVPSADAPVVVCLANDHTRRGVRRLLGRRRRRGWRRRDRNCLGPELQQAATATSPRRWWFSGSMGASSGNGAIRELGRRELHHDVACQIHDLDNSGTNEVILAGDRRLIVLDGRSGKPVSTFPIEQHASDCIVFADLSGKGWPSEILVKTRYAQIWAYSGDGRLLWTVKDPGGFRTAHQPLPVDLDGDGRDEILAGYAALNPDGSVRWVFQAENRVGGTAGTRIAGVSYVWPNGPKTLGLS